MRLFFGAAILLGVAAVTAAAPVDRADSTDTIRNAIHPDWTIDKAHSTVGFSVRHFFTPVTGRFSEYEVALTFDPDNPLSSRVSVWIDVASVNTNNARRDRHLQSSDFFDADSYPRITFESTGVRDAGAGEFIIDGDLTIRDVTRQIAMPVTLLGIKEMPEDMQEMFGSQVASFQGRLTIDRGDYDVGSGSWAEDTIVGSDVEIEITIEAKHEAH